MSLRRRLLVGAVAVVVVLLAGSTFASRAFHRHLVDQVDRELLSAVASPVFAGPRGRPVARALTEYFIAIGDSPASLVVVDSDLAADLPPPRIEPEQVLRHIGGPRERPTPFTAGSEDGSTTWRLVTYRAERGVVVVGAPLEGVEAALGRIRAVQAGVVVAVLAALGLVAGWTLRLGIRPVEEMAASADAIAAGDLSRRVPHPPETTEAGRLGAALNSMLGRIETAFRSREASEARLRRFAADASHELRTPLTSIRGYAELWGAGGLRGQGELDDAMRRIEQEASRMGGLVESLLLLARLDEDRPGEAAPVRLDLLAADAVADARAVEPDRPIDAHLEEVTVLGDRDQLAQVVANLLSNVRDHTPPGTRATVAVSSGEGRARLSVADQGPGLAPHQASQAFQRFWRADPARARRSGGSGLGLSIVHAVARAHGGSASIESEAGAGARFIVELPAVDQPDSPAPGSQLTGSSQG